MTFRIGRLASALVGGALFLTVHPALGMSECAKGNDPVRDPGWPAGSLALANLKARVGLMVGPEGGGRWTFFYAGQCPLLDGERLILGTGGDALVIAVDLATGKPVWEAPNPRRWQMTHSSITPVDFKGWRT